jgi:hypothetical protein
MVFLQGVEAYKFSDYIIIDAVFIELFLKFINKMRIVRSIFGQVNAPVAIRGNNIIILLGKLFGERKFINFSFYEGVADYFITHSGFKSIRCPAFYFCKYFCPFRCEKNIHKIISCDKLTQTWKPCFAC